MWIKASENLWQCPTYEVYMLPGEPNEWHALDALSHRTWPETFGTAQQAMLFCDRHPDGLTTQGRGARLLVHSLSQPLAPARAPACESPVQQMHACDPKPVTGWWAAVRQILSRWV
jgi:hypothetical protein